MQDQQQGTPATKSGIQAWWANASKNMRVGVGCAALVAVCAVCSIGALATQGNGGTSATNTANTSTHNTPTATHAPTKPTATAKPKAWHTVKTFSGVGDTSTDTMDIPSGAHLVWKITPANEYAAFIVDLYNADDSLNDIMAAGDGATSGTYTVHGGGSMYLKVGAANLASWSISIQVYS